MKNNKFKSCSVLLFAALCFLMLSGARSIVDAQSSSESRSGVSRKQSRDLISGTFSNGLKYYIKHNASPASRAEIWLAVNAGSIQEDEDQLGFAHFLEHMAFNGTKKLPGNTLIDVIEQSGMTFGADLNAYTSFDETVYQLVVPTDNQSYIDNGISIIHEWASGQILIDSLDVVMERGVVLGEWRQRFIDTISLRQFKEHISRSMGGHNRYADRLPIGSDELIKNATPEPIKRFYRDWYRPDLMAVIVVGDIDVDHVYSIVKSKFENISPAKIKRPFERPRINHDSRAALSVVKDFVNPSVVVEWPERIADTSRLGFIRSRAVRAILWDHLNDIYAKYSRIERRPFAFAQLRKASSSIRSSENIVELVIAMSPDSIKHALSYALSEIEKVAEEGIPEKDLGTAKAILLRTWQRTADGIDAIPSRRLATQYVGDFLEGTEPLIDPIEQLKTGEEILKELSNDDLKSAAAFWRNGLQRYVTLNIPLFASVRPPSDAEIMDIMSPTSVKTYVQENGAGLKQISESSHLSDNGKGSLGGKYAYASSVESSANVLSERYDTSAGIKTWQLKNGVRVVFKETVNNSDEVIIHAISPGGFSRLPDKLRISSGRLIADLLTASGSPGDKDRKEFVSNLRQSGLTRFGVVLSAFSEEVVVAGSSRHPEVLFQTIHRQFVDPHVDSTSLEEWKRTGMNSLTYSQQDGFAYSLTGDKRLAPPGALSVMFMDLDKGMEVFKDRFGDASDFTFYIVGSIAEDSARDMASRYLSTLPSTNRGVQEPLISTTVRELKGTVVSTEKNPRLQVTQAIAEIGFRGYLTDSSDKVIAEQQQLNTVAWILSRRLRNKLREEMSVTYGAAAQGFAVPLPAWYYNVGIQFMTAPEDINRSVDSVWSVIRELKENGPTQEELTMASRIQRRRLENLQQDNAWWVSHLNLYDRLGLSFSKLADDNLKQLTVDEYKQQIRKFLPEDSYVQTIAVPTDEAIRKAKEGEKNKS